MGPTRPRCAAVLLLVGLTALSVSACAPDADDSLAPLASYTASSSEPTPTPSPSPGEADAQELQSVAAAKETVERYYDALAQQGNAGYADWEMVLTPFWSGEVRTVESDRYGRHLANGRTTTGRTEIVSMDVLEYTPSPSGAFDAVRLELCTDSSGVRAFEGGEELQRAEDAILRFRTELLLQNQNDQSWTIHERTGTGEEEC